MSRTNPPLISRILYEYRSSVHFLSVTQMVREKNYPESCLTTPRRKDKKRNRLNYARISAACGKQLLYSFLVDASCQTYRANFSLMSLSSLSPSQDKMRARRRRPKEGVQILCPEGRTMFFRPCEPARRRHQEDSVFKIKLYTREAVKWIYVHTTRPKSLHARNSYS